MLRISHNVPRALHEADEDSTACLRQTASPAASYDPQRVQGVVLVIIRISQVTLPDIPLHVLNL